MNESFQKFNAQPKIRYNKYYTVHEFQNIHFFILISRFFNVTTT